MLVVNESFMSYNLIFNYITTHHNKDTKLQRVNASRLSWIPGFSAERGINSTRKNVLVRYAHVKREWATLSANYSIAISTSMPKIT